MSVNNHGHDGVNKIVFRKNGTFWKRSVWGSSTLLPQCHLLLIPVLLLPVTMVILEQASLCPRISETFKSWA